MDELPDLVLPTGTIGGAVWLVWRLLGRSDRREREAFLLVRQQRDEFRARLEATEADLTAARAELARYQALHGPLDPL